MKTLIFRLLLITTLILFIFPVDSFSKGGGKSGYKSSHSGRSSSKGGHYIGGSGSSHKGGHYRNPSTGNHYTKGGSSSKGSSPTYAASRSKTGSLSNESSSSISYHPSVKRDSKGRIIRSEEAKQAFLKSRGLKKVPPGYEVDHKIPLWAGGSDTAGNMQLLTKEQHKAKTKADYKKYGH